jgi:hypothetical protein
MARSRGLGDVYKRQLFRKSITSYRVPNLDLR